MARKHPRQRAAGGGSGGGGGGGGVTAVVVVVAVAVAAAAVISSSDSLSLSLKTKHKRAWRQGVRALSFQQTRTCKNPFGPGKDRSSLKRRDGAWAGLSRVNEASSLCGVVLGF